MYRSDTWQSREKGNARRLRDEMRRERERKKERCLSMSDLHKQVC